MTAVQLRQPSPDAVVSFSDFLLERFGLVASMQVSLVASIAVHILVIIGLGFKYIPVPRFDAAPLTYVVCDVTAEAWRTEFKVLDKVSERNGTLPTRAVYAVESGDGRC